MIMGYMVHHAIMVTGREGAAIDSARTMALDIFEGVAPVSPLSPVVTNGYQSFMVAPDGSKEGWAESDRGDVARAEFVAWLSSDPTWVEWAEVQFGDEGGHQKVLSASGMAGGEG